MTDDEEIDLDLQIRAAFHHLPDTGQLKYSVRKRIAKERFQQRLAMAIGIVAFAMFLPLFGLRTVKETAAPVLSTDAAHDHEVEVPGHTPRSWLSGKTEIAALMARHGVPANALAGFARAGYRLKHAKTCRLQGRAVLHLVYTNGKGEFSVYLRQRSQTMLAKSAMAVGGEHVAAFQTKLFDAIVVTEGSNADCVELATQLGSLI